MTHAPITHSSAPISSRTSRNKVSPDNIGGTQPLELDKARNMMASTSAATTNNKPFSPRMANLLHREPSPQELEAARQLVEHSLSSTASQPQPHVPELHKSPTQHQYQHQHQHQHSTPSVSHGYRDATEYPNAHAQIVQGSSTAPLTSAPIMQPSRTSPSAMNGMTTPGAQMCRYAFTYSMMSTRDQQT